jgi:hypothetical protein
MQADSLADLVKLCERINASSREKVD